MGAPASGFFRSLRTYNYRVWASGALVSNVGTWMQRTAQDWLVLTGLTHHSAAAVGIVMGLQFGPQMLFMPWSGFAADHFDQRKLLMVTQALLGTLAIALGVLTASGLVQLWHVYVFAFLFGCTTAFDSPVRQTFVSELVGDADLSNAVALNSTSFNAARMIGPAVAGLVIASVGVGWAFLLNGLSFVAVLISLTRLRVDELRSAKLKRPAKGGIAAGFRYVWARPDLRAILVMLFLIGTFGLNFPIFISTMAVNVFHADAGRYGLLSSMMAVGTMSGAFFGAGRSHPRFISLLFAATAFGAGCLLASVAPGYWWFGGALVMIGIAALTFTTETNSLMQLSTEPGMRGRVLAIRLAVALGGTPIGAPIVGWVADHWGPRWALLVGAASGFAAAIVAARTLARRAHEKS
ncbi:MFS transporter [Paraburkholderia silvatlantica]|uniref:Putative MFS family arabinose efflux permease n=1 Tax=Paraburkholderia silvatlantica TaxID=321895 RepID=A0A2V4TUA1_9BURK|nr:MFS transporter [Paraburkholderia silvatlantica]PYE24918.1 putative MFS family arabinose efflux permease [Paraburkholderia silvatlantica]TDR05112.1 putative MFS family arabinose efflux permease [Paraburkholderia silvatlantica]